MFEVRLSHEALKCYRKLPTKRLRQVNRVDLNSPFPRTFGDITITGTTSIDTSINPDARPINTNTKKMLGQADIVFVPDPTP